MSNTLPKYLIVFSFALFITQLSLALQASVSKLNIRPHPDRSITLVNTSNNLSARSFHSKFISARARAL